MVPHATITIIYIIVIEVSRMQLLLCAIYQNQKGVWLVFLFYLTSFNITPKFLINRENKMHFKLCIHQFHKKAKHTQTICQQIADELFGYFVELAL